MEWMLEEKRDVAGSILKVSAARIGNDILICVEGGTKPHIGCVVQAVPRASLTGDGSTSSTSSVLNLTGHKDEFLCRRLADLVCSAAGVTVVCTGGFHLDGITAEEIKEVTAAAGEIGSVILDKLCPISGGRQPS